MTNIAEPQIASLQTMLDTPEAVLSLLDNPRIFNKVGNRTELVMEIIYRWDEETRKMTHQVILNAVVYKNHDGTEGKLDYISKTAATLEDALRAALQAWKD